MRGYRTSEHNKERPTTSSAAWHGGLQAPLLSEPEGNAQPRLAWGLSNRLKQLPKISSLGCDLYMGIICVFLWSRVLCIYGPSHPRSHPPISPPPPTHPHPQGGGDIDIYIYVYRYIYIDIYIYMLTPPWSTPMIPNEGVTLFSPWPTFDHYARPFWCSLLIKRSMLLWRCRNKHWQDGKKQVFKAFDLQKNTICLEDKIIPSNKMCGRMQYRL